MGVVHLFIYLFFVFVSWNVANKGIRVWFKNAVCVFVKCCLLVEVRANGTSEGNQCSRKWVDVIAELSNVISKQPWPNTNPWS